MSREDATNRIRDRKLTKKVYNPKGDHKLAHDPILGRLDVRKNLGFKWKFFTNFNKTLSETKLEAGFDNERSFVSFHILGIMFFN